MPKKRSLYRRQSALQRRQLLLESLECRRMMAVDLAATAGVSGVSGYAALANAALYQQVNPSWFGQSTRLNGDADITNEDPATEYRCAAKSPCRSPY